MEIFSESYGYIAKKDVTGVYQYDWNIPFGFNSNGKLVMWLGDIASMDDMTQAILKPFNVASDHLLIDSEFYQAQMKCIFSKPIIEKRIHIIDTLGVQSFGEQEMIYNEEIARLDKLFSYLAVLSK